MFDFTLASEITTVQNAEMQLFSQKVGASMRPVWHAAVLLTCIISACILAGFLKTSKSLQNLDNSAVFANPISPPRNSEDDNRKSAQRLKGDGKIGSADFLSGTLYLKKARRLALYWKNGGFELWDTAQGHRLREVDRLRRPVGWCITSPDEASIVTGDRMVDPFNPDDRKLWWKEFVPSIAVWDTRTGVRKHLIPLPEVVAPPNYIHEWYARWLDNSRIVIVRLLRENLVRAAFDPQLVLVDTIVGKVIKTSEILECTGEHILLSPDRKLAILKDDNYCQHTENGLVTNYRNIYARTSILDMETLTVVSSWREPPIDRGGKEGVALLARWCPDGKRVITVDQDCIDEHRISKINLWDAQSGKKVRSYSCHEDYILDVALTTHNERMLTASEDRTLRVWNLRTGNLESILTGHQAGLNRVIVLPGDKLAVSAAEEQTAKVWDLTVGKLKFDLAGHDSAIRDLDVISDKIVRTVTLLGTATTWDCSNGKRLQVTPNASTFPKKFGVCELSEKNGTLYMRILNQ